MSGGIPAAQYDCPRRRSIAPAHVGVHGAGSRREDEERPHAHETGDEACEVEAPIKGGGQKKRSEEPEEDGAVPHEDEQVRLVDGGAVEPLQRRASTDAHRREEMDDRDHHQERRHDVGHQDPPAGCQSTMNSVAPVAVEERCGSTSSATWYDIPGTSVNRRPSASSVSSVPARQRSTCPFVHQ